MRASMLPEQQCMTPKTNGCRHRRLGTLIFPAHAGERSDQAVNYTTHPATGHDQDAQA